MTSFVTRTLGKLFPVIAALSINVVDVEEFDPRFAAANAAQSVVGEYG